MSAASATTLPAEPTTAPRKGLDAHELATLVSGVGRFADEFDDQLIAEFFARAARLDTATLSDALDKLGIAGQCYRIKPRSSGFRLAGRAWTLLYGPAGKPAGTVGDYIDDVPATVSVNKASEAELAAVKGLPKAVASAIVAARPFKTLDELVKVKGMGVKMLDKLKGGLSL